MKLKPLPNARGRKRTDIYVIFDHELCTNEVIMRHATTSEKAAINFCKKWPACEYKKLLLINDTFLPNKAKTN